jgi:hypothetical protein
MKKEKERNECNSAMCNNMDEPEEHFSGNI